MAGLQGKICLVTGATSGIGKVTARELARLGAEVVLVGRDPARTAAAVAEVKQAAGSGRVSSLLADLSRLDEVRQLAAAFQAAHPRLDVLVNNAGALFERRSTTADGLESTFALNHLSYFLLTRELVGLLKRSAPSRIVNVASRAHQRGRLDLGDLQSARRYAGYPVYATSKLCNILFTRELARRLAGTGVTANSLHPGLVHTGFGAGPGLFSLVLKLARPLMIDAEEGAQTSIYLASSPEVEGVSGRYFVKCREVEPSAAARDDAAAARLWAESERLAGTGPWP